MSLDTENWNQSFNTYTLSKLMLFFIFLSSMARSLRIVPHKRPSSNSGPQEINDDR